MKLQRKPSNARRAQKNAFSLSLHALEWLWRQFLQWPVIHNVYSPAFILYELWRDVGSADCELFADSFNEFEVLPYFCSVYSCDKRFGARGLWKNVEGTIKGRGHSSFGCIFHFQPIVNV